MELASAQLMHHILLEKVWGELQVKDKLVQASQEIHNLLEKLPGEQREYHTEEEQTFFDQPV